MQPIAVLGAGGHAKVVTDALVATGAFEVVGVVVPDPDVAQPVFGLPVLAEEELPRLLASGVTALAMGIGSTGDASRRRRLFRLRRDEGFGFPAVIHPSAAVSPHAEVSDGVYVGPNATVCAGAILGFGCIVNSGAVVDHDCVIGELAHVSPGAALSGNVTVGVEAHVGTGASVAHGVTIGAGAIVGAGAAVVDDVPEGVVAFGVPCRVVRERE